MSRLEETLAAQIRLAKLPLPEREVRVIEGRRFKFDFAWKDPDHKLLVEVQGGTFAKGKMGHSSGAGINRDLTKANLAVLAGWRVLAFDVKHIQSGEALRMLQEALRPKL